MTADYITLNRKNLELLEAYYRNAARQSSNPVAQRAYEDAADDMDDLVQLSLVYSEQAPAEMLRHLGYVRAALQGDASAGIALRCLDKAEAYLMSGQPCNALAAEENPIIGGKRRGVLLG